MQPKAVRSQRQVEAGRQGAAPAQEEVVLVEAWREEARLRQVAAVALLACRQGVCRKG